MLYLCLERNGRFHQLIKSSKRKRRERDAQLNEETKEQKFTYYINRQKDEIDDLKNELKEYKVKYEDRQKDIELLQKLYDNGYIDLDGNPIDKAL